MALRYGSKNAFALRYNPFSASALRYGSITMGMGGYDENATPARYFTFTLLDDDTYSIKAADVNNLPADLVIPSSYNGKPVTQIGDSCSFTLDEISSELVPPFSSLTGDVGNLVTVTIPNTITKIGDLAFYNQQNLQSVTFQEGSNLTHIGAYAFNACYSISSLTLQNGVTTIGETAFGGLNNLKQITIPASVVNMASSAVSWGYENKLILCEAESKPDGWDENWNLFSSNIKPIWNCNNYTFTYDSNRNAYMISVVIPSKLTGEFYIPPEYNGLPVDTIGSFAGTRVTNIYYPASITRIFYYAFDGCTSLAEFSHYQIEYKGESSIQEIHMNAFRDCSALTSIYIPASVTSMGTEVFDGCSALSINCRATEQPSGWSSTWNPDNRPVTWGY